MLASRVAGGRMPPCVCARIRVGVVASEGFAIVGVVWNGDVAIETEGEGNHAAEDEEPSPAGEAEVVVHAPVDAGLEVAAEHARCVAGGVEDGDSFREFCFFFISER